MSAARPDTNASSLELFLVGPAGDIHAGTISGRGHTTSPSSQAKLDTITAFPLSAGLAKLVESNPLLALNRITAGRLRKAEPATSPMFAHFSSWAPAEPAQEVGKPGRYYTLHTTTLGKICISI